LPTRNASQKKEKIAILGPEMTISK